MPNQIPEHLTLRKSTPADLPAIARMTHLAFASPLEGCRSWIEPLLADHRVLAAAGAEHSGELSAEVSAGIRAGVLTIPMGQYFGGKPVSMLGIAGVAVPPEARGSGYAERMMQGVLREAYDRKLGLSTLYASTQTLYRKVGYEQAGTRTRYRIPANALILRTTSDGAHAPRGGPTWRQLNPQDEQAVLNCYTNFAQHQNGMLQRGPYIWGRVKLFREKPFIGFGLPTDDPTRPELDAYVYLHQEKLASGRCNLLLSDLAYRTPAAARAVLEFLARFGTMTEEIQFSGGAGHPLLLLLAQQPATAMNGENWMMRIAHLPTAMDSRGYQVRAHEVLTLHITDSVLQANAGTWVLGVKNGNGTCRRPVHADTATAQPPTGQGLAQGLAQEGVAQGLALDIAALAALYSGFSSARELATLGLVRGDQTSLETADVIFGSTQRPWCCDFF